MTKTADEILSAMACDSGAIFTGHVVDAVSLPTEDGQLLFTDYTVTVTDAIRSPKGYKLGPAMTVIVTKPGGQLKVDGVQVAADFKAFPPLDPGEEYLFFVEFLPRYKTFHFKTPGYVWAIANGALKSLIPVATDDTEGLRLARATSLLRGVRCR